MAQDIFIRVRWCTRPSTVHRRDTWGSPNGKKHAGGIARNQDRATEVAGPEETLQRPRKPVTEARCGFRRMRTVIPIDCGQRFRSIADSVPVITDKGAARAPAALPP